DPVRRSLPLDATPEEYKLHKHALGLDKPLAIQFRDYMSDALHLRFGTSFSTQVPAMDLVRQRIPRTFELVAAGMAIGGLLGIPLGVALGLSRRRWFDAFGNGLSLVAVSLPQFWTGFLFLVLVAV